jgi:alpha-glucosidase (family GH31 glycosyl hydrolase)
MDPDSVYFCLCYGEAQVEGPGGTSQNVKTSHHEMPLFLRQGAAMRIEPAGFRDHRDEELVMLEALVGREPPFVKNGMYPANKY